MGGPVIIVIIVVMIGFAIVIIVVMIVLVIVIIVVIIVFAIVIIVVMIVLAFVTFGSFPVTETEAVKLPSIEKTTTSVWLQWNQHHHRHRNVG